MNSGLRVEWLKTRARAQRWNEELLLVEEEMRRALGWCYWRAQWWLQQVNKRSDVAAHIAEGIQAYAEEQSDAERQRSIRWATQWGDIRDRARAVVANMQSVSDGVESLPELVVELDDEDDLDHEGAEDDQDDDDDE